MASRCNPLFLIPRVSLQLLVLTMTCHSAVTESAPSIQLRGEVGGEVAFHCPVHKKQTLESLYFQKGDIFVNGYYASRKIEDISETWENTRMDLDKMTIIMSNLSVSHIGDYQCIIRYSGQSRVEPKIHLHLYVTANYSKPTLKRHCSDEKHHFCLVNCTSHGGYPATEVTWHIPGSLKLVNDSQMVDPDSTTFNISSIAFVNCSDGKPTSLRCSVDNVISEMFTVCTPKDPPDTRGPSVITTVAICAVVVVSVMAALLGWWHCKRSKDRY